MSSKCRKLYSKKNAEERGKSRSKMCAILMTSSILALRRSGPVSFDIGTDVTLLVKYSSGTSVDEISHFNCTFGSNDTSIMNSIPNDDQSWSISPEECFWLTLGDFVCFLIETKILGIMKAVEVQYFPTSPLEKGLFSSKSAQSGHFIIQIFWKIDKVTLLLLAPVLLPCIFNLFGVGSFLRKWKTRASCSILKYCSMIILTPIWLVLAALGEASEEFKTRSR